MGCEVFLARRNRRVAYRGQSAVIHYRRFHACLQRRKSAQNVERGAPELWMLIDLMDGTRQQRSDLLFYGWLERFWSLNGDTHPVADSAKRRGQAP